MPEDDIPRLAKTLNALSNPLSLRLVMLLRRKGALEVHVIVNSLRAPPVSQPTVSGQLIRLWKAGILKAERRGRTTTYALTDSLVDSVETICRKMHIGIKVPSALGGEHGG